MLDIRCDPDVPPIPPHATFAQAKATAGAILHGDEDAWGFVKQGIKQKAQQYLPGTQGRGLTCADAQPTAARPAACSTRRCTMCAPAGSSAACPR